VQSTPFSIRFLPTSERGSAPKRRRQSASLTIATGRAARFVFAVEKGPADDRFDAEQRHQREGLIGCRELLGLACPLRLNDANDTAPSR
jgi:hypothetical protein